MKSLHSLHGLHAVCTGLPPDERPGCMPDLLVTDPGHLGTLPPYQTPPPIPMPLTEREVDGIGHGRGGDGKSESEIKPCKASKRAQSFAFLVTVPQA